MLDDNQIRKQFESIVNYESSKTCRGERLFINSFESIVNYESSKTV